MPIDFAKIPPQFFSRILTKICEMESELNFLYFKVVSHSIPLTLWKGGEQQMKNVLL